MLPHDVPSFSGRLPTEPIGSIPSPAYLLEAIAKAPRVDDSTLQPVYERAVSETIECFEATESPIISDEEQRKYHNFLRP